MTITHGRKLFSVTLLLVILVCASDALSQFNSVDPTFQPVPSSPPVAPPNGPVKSQILQPDGKVITWIGNLAIDGVAKGQISRLNSDGSLDNSFQYCSCHLRDLTNVALQPDGKLLVAGSGLSSSPKVIRLNSDGSTDGSYNSALPPAAGGNNTVIWHVQSDGKAYVEVIQFSGGFTTRSIYRLQPDGSVDSGFTTIAAGGGQIVQSFPTDFTENGGKLYVALNTVTGGGGSATLKRFNLDGTTDSGYQAPTFGFDSQIYDIDFQSDGSAILSGRFITVNGFSKSNLARILPAGNVDLAFTAGPSVYAGGFVEVLGNGKLLWSARVSVGEERVFYRLNSDGSVDGTFVDPPSLVLLDGKWQLDSMERIYFYASDAKFHRLNPNGDIDSSFPPVVDEFGKVYAFARQADGKVLMAGTFTKVNGSSKPTIVRVNSDGTVDQSFDPGTGFSSSPTGLLVQPDGKILAIGSFTSYNGASRNGIVRINPNGSLDATFVGDVSSVKTIALQSDGKILIGGTFTMVNGASKSYLARLLTDGNLDNSFSPVLGGTGGVNDIRLQPDSKIMLAGGFSGVDGFSRPSLARLNADGTLDQSFSSGNLGTAELVRLQPSGKYVVALNNSIRRRNSDGSPDASFPILSFEGSSVSVDSILVEADGGLIVGGNFATINSVLRPNFARFSPEGGLDPLFFAAGANARVRAVVDGGSGKIIVGGDFWKISDAVRAGVARLNVVPFRKPVLFDFDGDGRADISVVRPSTNRWYEVVSSTGQVYEETFGLAGDILAPADFDGDGITDEAIFRPSNAQWWYRSSVNGNLVLSVAGTTGDIPRPSDFDGDGKADLVLFRPSNRTWYRVGSLNPNQQAPPVLFGLAGDQPLVGDFDGDGKSDLAVFRPSNGDWWYAATSEGGAFRNVHWGQTGDIPVPADYDGDGKTDYAVYRPSEGGWYVYNSGNGSFTTIAFGLNGDRPVAADYDGDGRADIAVFRPSTGIWYLLRSTSGFAGYQFGISTDIALPGALIP